MSVAVVTEKPSVARDIAQALGARTRGEGQVSFAAPEQGTPEADLTGWDRMGQV